MHSPTSLRHVLILGCGRSGTSIFGELFEHLPYYTYHSEPFVDQVPHLDFQTPQAIKVPRTHATYPASPGLSFPIEALDALVPPPQQLYWQVRHPLDAICSLRVGIAQKWGHHPKPPDWQAWLARPLLERCAYHWHYINSEGYARVADRAKIMRFEAMIADPLAFASEVCRDVGLRADAHLEALEAWAQRVQNTNNHRFVEAQTSRPYSRNDHHVKVGRWQENLTAEEIAQVRPLVEATAHRLGYVI
ncbi:Sulfotransferase domain-containing protein [Catalinimonas alkaloidigena]|uniref:Sulfotransferase domain-containing protein n=1 Tax=Catalinimonas alkaloidigena TaxID=1075417 RepID=A0A1G9N2P5_9BACT|nr:sulfotransferase domain-containing protein [Catalinimonas alkaloidigena]SDL80759.1 Sulfotransferase domain-containing protein [Catalinimonas alkaloidigena]